MAYLVVPETEKNGYQASLKSIQSLTDIVIELGQPTDTVSKKETI